ncbi:MAG TPA: pyridoxal-phosphate dependent enzyme, partial [Kofleriaceae bacterium]
RDNMRGETARDNTRPAPDRDNTRPAPDRDNTRPAPDRDNTRPAPDRDDMSGETARDKVLDDEVALFRYLPRLAAQVPWARMGDWPTPLDETRIDGRPIWIKREGDSNAHYGGNKVRTLEAWLGHVRGVGAERIWAIGAYGSNHAIATVIHARALGLDAGAIVFPQPASEWAIENAGALIGSGCKIVRLRNVIEVPFAGLALAAWDRWAQLAQRLGRRLGPRSIVMPPGGATPIGTLGALSAAFELAEQVAAGLAPAPRRIVLPVGSTCTTAGLVCGLALAHALGVWRWPVPVVHAVRVTPWPVTSRVMITQLAAYTLARIAQLGGPRVELGAARLVIDRRELGPGYGRITPRAHTAMSELDDERFPRLDGVYSGKAAAALLRLHREHAGPLLFWSTKSTTRLAPPSQQAVDRAPPALARWLAS